MTKKIFILLAFIVMIGAGVTALPCCSISSAASAAPPPLKVATLEVEKMTCGGCAMSVKMLVKKIDGVKEVSVSYEEKAAVVTYDPSQTSAESIAETINEKLPYVATVVSGEPEGE